MTATHKRLGIIIPYRDRYEHLARLLPHLISFFHRNKDDRISEVSMLVAEQADQLPFNRGALLNAGFLVVERSVDYVCFHDVDYLPMWADYTYSEMPTRIIWWGMHERPIRMKPGSLVVKPSKRPNLSAVTLMPCHTFRRVNGFSNRFFGWGFEDTDLSFRCSIHGIEIAQRNGTFIPLDHDHAGYTEDGSLSQTAADTERVWRQNQERYRHDGTANEGLSTLSTSLASRTAVRQVTRLHGLDQSEAADITRVLVTLAPPASSASAPASDQRSPGAP